jgi:hypothetical protein
VEWNTTTIIAAVLAGVLVLLNKGTLVEALKAFWAALTGTKPAAKTQLASTDTELPAVQARLDAVRLLQQFYTQVDCPEGLEATQTCLNHLLDDMKPHEQAS